MANKRGADYEQLRRWIAEGNVVPLREALRANPMLVRYRAPDGDTPLHWACLAKQVEVVEELLSYGPDVDAQGRLGRTALHCAVHRGDVRSTAIVRRLLAAGASTDIRDDKGLDAAERATRERPDYSEGLPELLMLLIDRKSMRAAAEPAPTPPPVLPATPLAPSMARPDTRAQTEIAIVQLLSSFVRGSHRRVEELLANCSAADEECVREAHRLLTQVNKSPWREPMREWLKENMQPEQIHKLVTRYLEARS